MASADIEAAWAEASLVRERHEYSVLLFIGSVLYPLYYLLDLALEPDLVSHLLGLRLTGTVIFWLGWLQVRRTRTLVSARGWFVATVSSTSVLVAYMLPQVGHTNVFLIGYSAYFWGCGAVSWPPRLGLAVMGWHLLAVAVAFALAPSGASEVDLVGGGLYLVAAAALSVTSGDIRLRAIRRAFVASHELAERNLELEDAMARLGEAQARLVAHEKLSALGRMLAGLSHELNNPLNVIMNNLAPVREHADALGATLRLARAPGTTAADLEQAWHERELDWRLDDLGDALAGMDAASNHMLQIHQDLRAFIRGDVHGPVEADVGAGLHATAALVARRVPADVTVEVDVAPLPAISCRPGQLNQVWLNLVQNALDAVGPEGRVTLQARALADHLEVSVSDSGPGIDPEIRGRLFEPFATTKPPGKGTGLGLAISYQIVELHGGRLYLDETHRGGARFVVELPRPVSAPPAAA